MYVNDGVTVLNAIQMSYQMFIGKKNKFFKNYLTLSY